ncbi:proheparin-binding EGF-like growth factor isoform X2 [Ranitomeya imitator]|uniref:proheparin-binding EGF-like growth factor isoform X2 n=1 Tax=Ranitomeya imitator TaxID=111125 RepID=UPI0037E8B530
MVPSLQSHHGPEWQSCGRPECDWGLSQEGSGQPYLRHQPLSGIVPPVPGRRRARRTCRLDGEGRLSGLSAAGLFLPGAAMKLVNFALVLALEGFLALTCLHGAVIDHNEVLHRASNELPEQAGLSGRPLLTGGNPMVASSRVYSSKPKDKQGEENIHNGRKKGKGRKRDPCLRRYKDFCIHGTCRVLKVTKEPYCVCQAGYHGQRCHALTLPLGNPLNTYDHTTILAVVAVVLSSFSLIVIASLLILRYHRTGAYKVDNEKNLKVTNPTLR